MPSIGTQTAVTYNRKSKRFVNRKKRMPFSKKQVKAIKKIAEHSSELKSKEVNGADVSITSPAPFAFTLNSFNLAEGDGDDERIGTKISVKDICYKFRVGPGSAGLSTLGHVYNINVIQHLGNETIGSSSQIGPLQFFQKANDTDEKYKILYHKTVTLQPSSQNNKFHNIKIKGKLLNQILFDVGTTTCQLNNVSLIVKPYTSVANELRLDYIARIRWYD